MDKRWQQLAEILVNYSARVKPGERVMLAMQEAETLPLVRAVYEEAVKAGAHVQVQFVSDYLRRSLLRYGTPEQVGWVPEIEAYGMQWADVYFGLRGAHNPHEFADIPADRIALHQGAMGAVSSLRWQQTRWCLVRVPNAALAQQAETDLETLMDTFFAACLRDWPAESGRWQQAANLLNRGQRVRLLAHDTDLSFSTMGRTWVVGDGRLNMPDGEIYTAPITASLNGCISFELPQWYGNRPVGGIHLAWRDGVLVEAAAAQNDDLLQQVLATDPGARLVGEFAIGTNYGLTRFTSDFLLDEKIGGTVHIALGRAYPQCGGDNVSKIHWDLIKDTRLEGSLYIDDRLVMENGVLQA
ncbi:MAG: aminopeptidase [Anaerolineae bacterium]